MADKDKLTTSDIVDQTQSNSQAGNGEARRDTTASDATDISVEDARARLDRSQTDSSASPNKPDSATDGADTALLEDSEAQDLRRRWTDIQTTFVDRPKDSVSQADELVAETIKRLAEGFAGERDNLESVWSQGGDVSTEDLRVALQRYRSFFERLLNA